jgi:hypothetical protein
VLSSSKFYNPYKNPNKGEPENVCRLKLDLEEEGLRLNIEIQYIRKSTEMLASPPTNIEQFRWLVPILQTKNPCSLPRYKHAFSLNDSKGKGKIVPVLK